MLGWLRKGINDHYYLVSDIETYKGNKTPHLINSKVLAVVVWNSKEKRCEYTVDGLVTNHLGKKYPSLDQAKIKVEGMVRAYLKDLYHQAYNVTPIEQTT